jgi:hypothetical protein
MDYKFELICTTPTITFSRRTHNYNHNFTIPSNIFRTFMSSHDKVHKTSLVNLLAVILGLGGFATVSIFFKYPWQVGGY